MAVNFDALRKMGTTDLRELNQALVQVINERNAAQRQSQMRQFNVGDKAWFKHTRTGQIVNVIVQKFNTKSIGCAEVDATGRTIPGRTWRVAPSFLQYAE